MPIGVSRPVAPAAAKFMPIGLAVIGPAEGFDTDGEAVPGGVCRGSSSLVVPWGLGMCARKLVALSGPHCARG